MSYDESKPVRILVGSYGHYNAGYLEGDWFSLPMDHDELWEGINKACKVNPFNEEVGCFDYECDLEGVQLSEYMGIDEINALAAAFESATDCQIEATEAYIEHEASVYPLQAANILINADDISYYQYDYDCDWMSVDEKYGRTTLNAYDPDLANILEERGYTDYFDYEALARSTDDTLCENGYLMAQGDTPDDDTYTAIEILEKYGYYTKHDEKAA